MINTNQIYAIQGQSPVNPQVFSGVNAAYNLLKQGWNNLVRFTQNSEKYMELVGMVENWISQGTQVSVQVNGSAESHASKITAVNIRQGRIVIDAIDTGNATRALAPGKELVIVAEDGGRKISIPCHFIDNLVPGMNLGYELKLPSAITH